jgi:maltose/moltooligosaccharide transporter
VTRRRLNLFQIWNLCFGFFGIQIGFGLQNANTSRIFQTLGADVDQLPLLWIAAPLTGLVVQPIIGHFSDKTWGFLGRRRPYFFFGALLTTAALLIMPNSPALWVAAGSLWVMDASINVTMEPFRAFVADQLPEEQRTTGYAMQSFFIGSGAVFASALPWVLTNWFGVANTAAAGAVPVSVKLAFYCGAAGLLLAVMWTVFTTREYSPEEMLAFEAASAAARNGPPEQRAVRSATVMATGLLFILIGFAGVFGVYALNLAKELYLLAGFIAAFGLIQALAAATRGKGEASGFHELVEDFFRMPRTMQQLAVVQFFSWFGLFAMWIYATPAVAAVHFHATDTTSKAYNAGADWVGVLFAIYSGVAALAAMMIPRIAAAVGRKAAHALCLCLGAAGFVSIMLIRDPQWLWVSMVGVGFAWSSIVSTPYAILAGSLPERKVGVYMGIFNFFIVIPQLLAATVLGLLLKSFFGGAAIWALVLGAASFAVAALATLVVADPLAKRGSDAVAAP